MKSRLQTLANEIKAKAVELTYQENIIDNGNKTIEFQFETKSGALIDVKAVCEIFNFYYNAGSYLEPSEIYFDVDFSNGNVDMILNENCVEMVNVTNELNKLLN